MIIKGHSARSDSQSTGMLWTPPSFLACLKVTALCMCGIRGSLLKIAHLWQLCHPKTPLQAESHAEVAEECCYWACGHLFDSRACNMDGCWQNTSPSFWVTLTEFVMCIIKKLIEEEKGFQWCSAWAVLHFRSAKVLLIGVAELFAVALRKHCDMQNQAASACLTFPVTSSLSL